MFALIQQEGIAGPQSSTAIARKVGVVMWERVEIR